MQIVVYRNKGEDADKVCRYLSDKLLKEYPYGFRVHHNRKYIVIGDDVHIDFYSSNINKIRGLRPDYYNTDSYYASLYLKEAVGIGKELESVIDILDVVSKHMESKNHDRKEITESEVNNKE